MIARTSEIEVENPYLSGIDKSLTPEEKELEQWKFHKHQMEMFARVGFFLGGTLFLWGIIGGYILLEVPDFFAVFKLDCDANNPHLWFADGLGGELFLGFHMLITMFYITMYYFIYWMVPKWHNQVLKTESEVLCLSIKYI